MHGRPSSVKLLVMALVSSCSQGGVADQAGRSDALPTGGGITSPCAARNPIRLIEVNPVRSTGQPKNESFAFSVAAPTGACVRIENPDVQGHRVTAAWVSLDGQPVLGPADFNQQFAGVSLSRQLSQGAHALEVRLASKPGTKLLISVSVPGPVIDTIAPEYGPAGTSVRLFGEGFVGPVTIQSGSVGLQNPTLDSSSEASAVTVPELPIGPLTITTPFGSASSPMPFVPSEPAGFVPFYPQNEFDISEASCSGQARLLIRQDGSRLAFVIDDQLPSQSLALDIDREGDHASFDWSLAHPRPALTSVFTQTFAALDLHSHLSHGRLFLRVRSTGQCGSRTSSWIDLRSVFSPGFVIVRSQQPAAIARRLGLQVIASEGDLTEMKLAPTMNMNEVLLALARDPDSQGSLPANVLYQTNHAGSQSTCGLTGTVHESGPGSLSQWTLDRIGFGPTNHPSATAGAGVVVAVLDTGLAAGHGELSGSVVAGRDFTIFGDGTTADVDLRGFHGTGVASVIAARAGNGAMVGIAPGATIMPMRILGSTGMADGFALHRAFAAVLTARAMGVNVQVVNASLAEFLDTYLLAGGIVAAVGLRLNMVGAVSVVGGLIVRDILRSGVRSLSVAGVAVVVAAGNFGDTVAAPFGMQFPANAPDSFAVAATDQFDRVVPTSMRAVGGQRIALSAPSELRLPDGGTTPGTVAAFGTGIGTPCVGGGTSYASPHVAGAVAALLAPTPPLGVTNGLTAALRLVATARPTADPANAGGAGIVNLATAQLPAVAWSFDFQSNFRRIDDFAFLAGVGDFALRASGTRLERISSPSGNISVSVPLPAAAQWINSLPATNEVLIGYANGIEVRRADGTQPRMARTVASTFRAEVATRFSQAGQLVALGTVSGAVELARGASFSSVLLLQASQQGEAFLDARWVPVATVSEELLAARTPSQIEVFAIPVGVSSGCVLGDPGCARRLGAVRLSLAQSSGAVLINPTDWVAVQDPGGPRVVVVEGTGRILSGNLAGQLSVLSQQMGLAFSQIESSQAGTTVYAFDLSTPAVLAIRNGAVFFADSQRAGESPFEAQAPFRLAPTGTYGYAAGRTLRMPNESWAIFVGGLLP